VQTWDPDHPSIALAVRHDVGAFLERELADRRELGYPPFTHAALLRLDGPEEDAVRAACTLLADAARATPAVRSGAVLAQGPAPAPIARIRNRFRFRLMLRAAQRADLRTVLTVLDRAISDKKTLGRGVRAAIDVDPVQLL
jgi:primosomal protein N' (replication factor Y)